VTILLLRNYNSSIFNDLKTFVIMAWRIPLIIKYVKHTPRVTMKEHHPFGESNMDLCKNSMAISDSNNGLIT
jgi:hypothetical protein